MASEHNAGQFWVLSLFHSTDYYGGDIHFRFTWP